MRIKDLEYKTILKAEFFLSFAIVAVTLFLLNYNFEVQPLKLFAQFNKTSIYGSIISATLCLIGFLISAIAFLLALMQNKIWSSPGIKTIFNQIFELWYSFIHELTLLTCLAFAALFSDITEATTIYINILRYLILSLFVTSILRIKRSAGILKSITDICIAAN